MVAARTALTWPGGWLVNQDGVALVTRVVIKKSNLPKGQKRKVLGGKEHNRKPAFLGEFLPPPVQMESLSDSLMMSRSANRQYALRYIILC